MSRRRRNLNDARGDSDSNDEGSPGSAVQG